MVDLFSLPYLFLGSILIWTGLLSLLFFFPIAKGKFEKQEHFFFALLTFFFGIFSFCSGVFYGSEDPELIRHWGTIKAFCGMNAAIMFSPYAACTLRLKQNYFRKIYPFISLPTLLFFFNPGIFVIPKINIHSIVFWDYTFIQPHLTLTPFSYLYLSIILAHSFVILVLWIKQRKDSAEKNFFIWFAFFFFVVFGTHEILLSFGVYRFISLATFAFSAFLILMAFKLFRDFIQVNYGLLHASKDFRRTNEEMRFLVSAISHDTIAPLISIRGFVDLLSEKNKEKERNNSELHYLHRIQANTSHVRALLGDLAKYARIGRVEEKVEKLDLNTTFQQAIEMLHLEHQYPGTKVQLQGHWRDFLGSDKQLKQIITNLLINAIRHANRPDVNIVIDNSDQNTKLNNKGVFFSLKDNGPGISPTLQQKIFKTFYKSSSNSNGFGMGLAIAKKIVTNMGGDIWIDPNYQKGARFCVHLPSLADNR